MSVVKGGIVAVIMIGLVLTAAYFGVFSIGGQNPGSPGTLPISFSALDKLAGSQDATTSAVGVYTLINGDPVLQETVTINAANVESTRDYTSGQVLLLKLYDASDTSVCTQYQVWTVPSADASNVYNGAFRLDLNFVDRGDTAIDTYLTEFNGTAIADAATVDCSNSGYDSAYATWTFTARQPTDDKGYVNSYNFLNGYGNYHYIVLKISGTGWDRVVPLDSGLKTFERNNIKYICFPLSDSDLTRDLQSDNSYNPLGKKDITVSFDLTSITSGDSVTLEYSYRYYADWENFKTTGSWGINSATSPATAETITIEP